MNLTTDQLNFIALVISTVSALAALGLYFSSRQQRTGGKEDFLLWAMERLRQDDLRKCRAQVFALSD